MPNNERFRLRYDLQMNAADESADVMIYGEICDDWWKWTEADISATDFDKLLKDAKAKGVKNLTIRINSPGGDVNQAIAMRTMLMNSGMEEIKISIEGMCASAATLIACLPGAHVTMTEGGEYMIHNPKSGAWGEAKDLEAGAKRLRNTEADSASIYARKSGQSEETVRGWMNAETWMTAKEAHERGFVDAVLDAEPIVASVSNRAMAAMRRMYTHIPESVQEHADVPVEHHAAEADQRRGAARYVRLALVVRDGQGEVGVRAVEHVEFRAGIAHNYHLATMIASRRARVNSIAKRSAPGVK